MTHPTRSVIFGFAVASVVLWCLTGYLTYQATDSMPAAGAVLSGLLFLRVNPWARMLGRDFDADETQEKRHDALCKKFEDVQHVISGNFRGMGDRVGRDFDGLRLGLSALQRQIERLGT